jgi:hypothetical protein
LGGNGGPGGAGGSGGSGGNGGRGTPGMLKLHGSIILANPMTVFAVNGPSSPLPQDNGKLTIISNMNATAIALNRPGTLTPNTIDVGTTENPAIQGTTAFTPATDHPFIPQLQGGPATEGLLTSGYYNQTTVTFTPPIQSVFGPNPASDRLDLKVLTEAGGNSLYDGYDQIFVVNISPSYTFTGVSLKVGANAPAKINAGSGSLGPGQTWTTTIPAGTFPQLLLSPVINQQPQSQGVFPGASVSFTVLVTSDTPVSYQWQFQPVDNLGNPVGPYSDIVGATNNTFSILSVTEARQGNYRVLVTNAADTVISNPAFLNVFDPPVITQQPQPVVNVFPTLMAQFSIEVSVDTVAPNFQWEKFDSGTSSWVSIPGAQTKVLTIASAQESDEGDYRCVVSNLAGTTISNTGHLNVYDGVAITQHPTDQTLPPGYTAVFTVVAVGQPPVFYQWQKAPTATGPWVDISESENPTRDDPSLFINSVTFADSGFYRCKVTNFASPSGVFSNAAQLTVNDPGILLHPQSQAVDPGTPVSFLVIAAGSGTLTYQWYKDGNPIPGATLPTYSIVAAQESDQGSYVVRIQNNVGSVLSNPAILTVYDPPSIVQEPQDVQLGAGSTAQFQVVVSNPDNRPLTYQWYKNTIAFPLSNGGNIAGATSDTLTISNITDPDEARYFVVVSSPAGSVESRHARLVVGQLLTIIQQPASANVYVNTSFHRFTIRTLGGKGTRFYDWKKNGVVINTQTSTASPAEVSFDLFDITFADAGTYTCEINDARNEPIESDAAVLAVFDHLSAPTINATSPVELTEGDTLTLTVTVSGGIPPLTYEWKRDRGTKAVENVGTNSPTLSLSPVQPSDSGTYWVVVSDSGTDSAESNHVNVVVQANIPAANTVGIALLAVLSAVAGVFLLRQRKERQAE